MLFKQLAATIGCISLLSLASAQIGPGGGSGGPSGGSNWQVLAVERNGSNTYYNWIYDENGNPAQYNFSMPWSGIEMMGAYNATHYSLAPKMISSGTVKVKIKWVGTGPTPTNVWMKISSNAWYGLTMPVMDDGPTASGTADDGIGDPVVPTSGGGTSSGYEYYKVSVGSGGIAEKTITLYAESTYTAPYASVGASCGSAWAQPDILVFDSDLMEFTNVLTSIINQNSLFGSTQGSAYPVNGWRKVNQMPEAYPVLMKKGTKIDVSFHYKADVDWAEPSPAVQYDLSASHSSYQTFINWPIQQGTASDSFQTKSFSSVQYLQNKIYILPYNLSWHLVPEQPFAITDLGTGTESMYVTWDSPLGETVTRKRIHWAVTSANGATTIEQAADGIHVALGGNPPYEPGAPGKSLLPDGADEWQLLDSSTSYYGECDEQARLMRHGMRLLGIDANVQLVRASSDSTNVLDLESRASQDHPGYTEYLIYYYPGANAFEGCCVVPDGVQNIWYAVWPQIKRYSALEILRALCNGGAVQRWVVMENGYVPGTGNSWGNHIIAQGEVQPCP